MGNANRYKREQDLIFQQIEELEKRANLTDSKIESAQIDQLVIQLISSVPINDLMAAVPPEARQEIIDACIGAWKERKTSEE
jgi:hypothetical protein